MKLLRPSRIAAALGALVLLTAVAPAQATTISWTFDGPKAGLSKVTPAWQNDLGESATTGRGVFRIRRALETTPNAFFRLPEELADQPLWLLVRVSEWNLSGKSNEVVRLGFSSNDEEKPNVVAQIKFERQEPSLLVSAESFPNTLEGSSLAAQPAGKGITGGKLMVLLHIDPKARTYRASMQTLQGKTWQPLGEGKIARNRVARYVRLGASGPFNTTSAEKFDIDEIIVSTSDPTK
jgi:hypothetical protein